MSGISPTALCKLAPLPPPPRSSKQAAIKAATPGDALTDMLVDLLLSDLGVLEPASNLAPLQVGGCCAGCRAADC